MYWALPNLVVLPAVLGASGTAHLHCCLVNGSVLLHLPNFWNIALVAPAVWPRVGVVPISNVLMLHKPSSSV